MDKNTQYRARLFVYLNMTTYRSNPGLPTILPSSEWKGTPVDDKGRFMNIHPFRQRTRDLLKWQTSRNQYREEKRREQWAPPVVTDASWTESLDDCILWLGHSTFFIRINGIELITDPVFEHITAFKRRSQLPVDPQLLRHLDYVLLSHDHRDHFDKRSLRTIAANNPGVKYLAGLDSAPLIRQYTGSSNIETAGWYQQFTTEERDLSVYFLPSRHWSKRGLFDTNARLWGAFVIKTTDKCIYFSGDSGYDSHFKDAQRIFGSFDYAILGIGAFEPVWFMRNVHMSPAEALQAARDLHAKHIIPMHYGTFDLSDEPLGKPIEVLLQHAGVESVLPLRHGEVLLMD